MSRQADGSLIYEILVEYKFYSKNIDDKDIPVNYDFALDEGDLDFRIVLTNLSDEVFPSSRFRNIYTRSDSSIDNDDNYPFDGLGTIGPIAPKTSFEFPVPIRQIATGKIKVGVVLDSVDSNCQFILLVNNNGEDVPQSPYAGQRMSNGLVSSVAQAEKKVFLISDTEIHNLQKEKEQKMWEEIARWGTFMMVFLTFLDRMTEGVLVNNIFLPIWQFLFPPIG